MPPDRLATVLYILPLMPSKESQLLDLSQVFLDAVDPTAVAIYSCSVRCVATTMMGRSLVCPARCMFGWLRASGRLNNSFSNRISCWIRVINDGWRPANRGWHYDLGCVAGWWKHEGENGGWPC
jgi:hypothetical protein